MDKITLKNTIIGFRESGMSYADIANKLESEYKVVMTRQAVCGMYNRLINDNNIIKNKKIILSTTDICNYAVLGMSIRGISRKLSESNIDIPLDKIKDIINKNEDYLKIIEDDIIDKCVDMLKYGHTIEEVENEIRYNGVKPNDKIVSIFKYKVSERYVLDTTTNAMAKIFKITGDRALVKNLISKHNFDISLKEIGKIGKED